MTRNGSSVQNGMIAQSREGRVLSGAVFLAGWAAFLNGPFACGKVGDRAMRDIGAWFLFLPPYCPDLNPNEMAFSKL